ncbi:MAG: signal peptidase I [Lachnospiraceae bacterium]|jgi:signal peptidase I|nr:signal peptidase I [Lachnospiraceae bacterium]
MKKKRYLLQEILNVSLYLLIVLIMTLLVVRFVGERTRVNGDSMETTLSDGDNLIVNKIQYRFSKPKRFDVVVFSFKYASQTYYIKRIIGLPGETVQIKDSVIYINDEPLPESYGIEAMKDAGLASEKIRLGKNEYFVLGDNRNRSVDSRDPSVGPVAKSSIVGKAWLRIYPFYKFGGV